MKSLVLTAAALAASVSARFPSPTAGVVESLSASAEAQPGTLPEISAMGVRSFTDVSGTLVWVHAKEHFLLAKEPILEDTYLQVTEDVAKELKRMGRVDPATDAEVAAAQAAEAKAKK